MLLKTSAIGRNSIEFTRHQEMHILGNQIIFVLVLEVLCNFHMIHKTSN